jgi:hypothetical protein
VRFDDSETAEPGVHHSVVPRILDQQQAVGNQAVQRMISDAPVGASELGRTQSSGAGGDHLSHETRVIMGNEFGVDFSDVRIHADEEAAGSAAALDASAYTIGREIYFAPGKYAPGKPEGARLLAHELAHVVQQSGGSQSQKEPGISADAESEAVRASDRVAAGGTVDFALSAAPSRGPACSPADWRKDVVEAKTAKDAVAMGKLVETALAASKRKVIIAKTSPGGNVNPKDYQPLPDINFDINLNSKNSKPLSSGLKAVAVTHSLGANYGYSFSDAGRNYVVLGPNALDENGSSFTQMYYSHEIYHTIHHLGTHPTQASPAPLTSAPPTAAAGPGPTTPNYKDEELETYTQDFLNYFHQLHGFRPQWAPLIKYYEESSTSAQKSSLALLRSYYANPPSPPIVSGEAPAIKKAFEDWLRRRLKDPTISSKKLVQDLSTALGIGLSGPSPGSPPTPTSGPIVPSAPH